MSSITQAILNTETYSVQNGEQQLLEHLIHMTREDGLKIDRDAIVNLYVSLKSKPMTLLIGPPGGGKNEIIRCLAEVLTGGNPLRCQLMTGHAWWAQQTGNVVQFATMQARFNDQKLLSIIGEALQPENDGTVHLACLSRISSAELSNIFIEFSSQPNIRIQRLPTIWLPQELPFPSNLLLIGTMDAVTEPEVSVELYAYTNVIWWPANATQHLSQKTQFSSSDWNSTTRLDSTFLTAALRDEHAACEKLDSLIDWQHIDTPTWRMLEALFHKHEYHALERVRAELIIYLANAWDCEARGLFSENSTENFSTALDFALVQILLPRLVHVSHELPELVTELERLVGDRLPRSSSWLNARR